MFALLVPARQPGPFTHVCIDDAPVTISTLRLQRRRELGSQRLNGLCYLMLATATYFAVGDLSTPIRVAVSLHRRVCWCVLSKPSRRQRL